MKKLNAQGIAHYLAIFVFVAGFAIVGTYLLVRSKAATIVPYTYTEQANQLKLTNGATLVKSKKGSSLGTYVKVPSGSGSTQAYASMASLADVNKTGTTYAALNNIYNTYQGYQFQVCANVMVPSGSTTIVILNFQRSTTEQQDLVTTQLSGTIYVQQCTVPATMTKNGWNVPSIKSTGADIYVKDMSIKITSNPSTPTYTANIVKQATQLTPMYGASLTTLPDGSSAVTATSPSQVVYFTNPLDGNLVKSQVTDVLKQYSGHLARTCANLQITAITSNGGQGQLILETFTGSSVDGTKPLYTSTTTSFTDLCTPFVKIDPTTWFGGMASSPFVEPNGLTAQVKSMAIQVQ
jgi:hypothetical protein